MTAAPPRSPLRSLVGLAAVSLTIAAVVVIAPDPPAESAGGWQPPSGYVDAERVTLDDGRTLRLWAGPSGSYVESLDAGRSTAAVGTSGGGPEYAISEILGGLLGYLPLREARTVLVGSSSVRADVHAQRFLVAATAVDVADGRVRLTVLDGTGRTLARATVEITGRG
ncbi:hypothetical protein [Micromonospora rifamycinica]|uniref:Uncharacterized protein n=1 Tax=Micromonospora rifamycinica TaxID=291594 RepID=A0A109IIF8_9ACTN|nr:hypothetical protein [Micromonospora rifamycinica]KWV31119.1 hypothetical protein AWV63_19265 [Micromonospora rifamycinica]SCG51326.1 hypothetical protein GA0070623_1915 [Micromonospora rifamycinica]